MTEHAERATRAAAQRVADRYTPSADTELHTADGGVYRGRDRDDIAANMQLRLHLELRRLRGRDPMIAHLLGFFEGAAAWRRGDASQITVESVA